VEVNPSLSCELIRFCRGSLSKNSFLKSFYLDFSGEAVRTIALYIIFKKFDIIALFTDTAVCHSKDCFNKPPSHPWLEWIFIIVFVLMCSFTLHYIDSLETGPLVPEWTCPIIWFGALPVPITLYGFFFVFAVAIREIIRMHTELSTLLSWSVDTACPMLWKDPLADYIWWLA
jgi:hypothetical protein